MAALGFTVDTGENAFIASASKTVIAIAAPTNQRVKINNVAVFGKGISNTDTPMKVELMSFTSISAGTAGSVVTSKDDGDQGETIQSSITGNYSAEPTYGGLVVFKTVEVHPQLGLPFILPVPRILKGGTGFAVRVTVNQAETVAASVNAEE
jgi:hypothetical protein